MNTINKVEAVKSLQNYINTYDQQAGYDKYADKTFILDILYGLGIAIDDQNYYSAKGFELLLTDLKMIIDKELSKKRKSKAAK